MTKKQYRESLEIKTVRELQNLCADKGLLKGSRDYVPEKGVLVELLVSAFQSGSRKAKVIERVLE